MQALGAAIGSIVAAGHWDNEAKATRCASPPHGWEFFLPDNVPWPTPAFGVEIRPIHVCQLWAMGTFAPHALTRQRPLQSSPMSDLGTMGLEGPT